jgi:nucleoid-associated protein EbfC
MFKDMNKMMQQAQKLQEKMAEMQAKMQDIESEGSAGGGLVKCTLNGKGEAKSVTIDPSLLKEEEKEVLEDLIVAAMNDAKIKVDQKSQDEMQKVTGGLNLPFNI